MGCIEPFIIFPVAPFHFSIMPGCKRPDELMPNAMLLQVCLEKSGSVLLRGEAVCELRSVVCLDAFDGTREGLDQVVNEHGGRIGAMLFKSFHKPPAGEFINGGVLEELSTDDFWILEAGRRDKFHIHLNTLARVTHLLIRLGDILGIRRFNGHNALPSEETVQPGDRTGIAPLPELNPENNQPGIRVAPTHVPDESNLRRGMLVRMVMGSSGAVAQGLDGAIIPAFPAINVLPVGFIFGGSFRDTIFISIINEG